MASGDFLDLGEQAARSAQLDPSDTTGDLAQALKKVNEAYLSVCHTGDPWDFLEQEGQFTTVASSDVYSYSSIITAMAVTGASIREITQLTIDTPSVGGVFMRSMDWPALESLTISTQDDEGTGVPYQWAKWQSRVRLFPIPDAVYTIGVFCSLSPDEMVDNTDEPLIPLAWRHRILVPYAGALLLEQEGGNESGNQYERLMRRYQDAFASMRTALATAKRPTFNAVQPGFMEREMAGGGLGGWAGW